MDWSQKRRMLAEDGYCLIEDALPTGLLQTTRRQAAAIVEGISTDHRARNRSQGSLVLMADHPGFADLIASPLDEGIFRGLGFRDPRFSSGYVISKPPRSPALFWHQDWWAWDDPISYRETVAQVFLFYYLTDTGVENGCLRVIPGSHRRRHPLHDLPPAHDEALSRVASPDSTVYSSVEGEIPVEVAAGSVVIGDARLLHGSYPNNTDRERTLITLWYHPDFAGLPAPIKARIDGIFNRRGVDTDPDWAEGMTPARWPTAEREKVARLFPTYDGAAEPQPWNREPAGLT